MSETVAADTRDQARRAGIEVVELPLWYDVDDGATLDILKAELLAGIAPGFATLPGYSAPHTREFLLAQDLSLKAMLGAETLDAIAGEERVEHSQERAQ